MRVLVIGSGGREHALVWKLSKSSHVSKIFWAPGNGGADRDIEVVNISSESINDLVEFVSKKKIDFVVVGPEAPLALGIVDFMRKKGVSVFGPTKGCARLESSKIFAKEFCKKNQIPVPNFFIFYKEEEAKRFVESAEARFPLVIKADGLAQGKGVIIANDTKEACDAIRKMMVEKVFKEAGERVLIEEFLMGEEASVMAISDGEKSLLLPTAKDYKRALDNDKGLNTGGMGAVSPNPHLKDKKLMEEIKEKIINRTIDSIREEEGPFIGILYAGLMLTEEGPKVLEFNVRFGDPETQVVLPRIKNDLFELLYSASNRTLSDMIIEEEDFKSVSVVATSKGYPESYEKGFEISGLDKIKNLNDVIVFHAGTKKEGERILTNGGRVLNIVGIGKSNEEARDKAYRALSYINFKGLTFRSDIACKLT